MFEMLPHELLYIFLIQNQKQFVTTLYRYMMIVMMMIVTLLWGEMEKLTMILFMG